MIEAALGAAIDAYRKRYETTSLGPLIVPDWFPSLCRAEGRDDGWIDEQARSFGFDGFITVSEVPS